MAAAAAAAATAARTSLALFERPLQRCAQETRDGRAGDQKRSSFVNGRVYFNRHDNGGCSTTNDSSSSKKETNFRKPETSRQLVCNSNFLFFNFEFLLDSCRDPSLAVVVAVVVVPKVRRLRFFVELKRKLLANNVEDLFFCGRLGLRHAQRRECVTNIEITGRSVLRIERLVPKQKSFMLQLWIGGLLKRNAFELSTKYAWQLLVAESRLNHRRRRA